jgi:hypothetical protein
MHFFPKHFIAISLCFHSMELTQIKKHFKRKTLSLDYSVGFQGISVSLGDFDLDFVCAQDFWQFFLEL